MVFYFKVRPEAGDYTIFMGLDKYENEDLIKYGFPEDIWFHVDKMSSAHVYVRLNKGQTMDDMSEGLLEDCAQLVKANSIQGNKVNNIDVVYTPWYNLKKTPSMDVGQVGFHNPKLVSDRFSNRGVGLDADSIRVASPHVARRRMGAACAKRRCAQETGGRLRSEGVAGGKHEGVTPTPLRGGAPSWNPLHLRGGGKRGERGSEEGGGAPGTQRCRLPASICDPHPICSLICNSSTAFFSQVRTIKVEKRINEIVNRLNKTKVERKPDLKAEREAVSAAEKAERKAQLRDKKRREEMERLEKEKQADIRSYKGLMVQEKMTSNKQIASGSKTLQELEEDFM